MSGGTALAIIALLVGVVALLGLAIWSIKRHKDPHLELDTDAPIEKLIASLSGMALGMPIAGNAVEIFRNGAFFDALIADISAARQSVHFETFLWKDGRLGRRLAGALAERARAGRAGKCRTPAAGWRSTTPGACATSACSPSATTAS